MARYDKVGRLLRTPIGAVGALLLLLVVVVAVLAPLLLGSAADELQPTRANLDPSLAHPLGTDELGRDLLARVLVAARLSVGLAVVATAIGCALGFGLGLVPAVVGARAQRLVGSVIGVAVAFPGLLLALFVATIVGVGALGATLALGIAAVPAYARLAQTLAAAIGNADYVVAARALGLARRRVLMRHVLPNVAEPLVVQVALTTGAALVALSALSFLGLGVQPPDYDWGALLADGLDRIYTSPAAALGPALAIVVAGLGFNLLGEAVARELSATDGPAPLGRRARMRSRDAAPDRAHADRVAKLPAPPPGEQAVASVRGLRVVFPGMQQPCAVVHGVDLDLLPGERVGIVGESGSGKSLTAAAVASLVPFPGRVEVDDIAISGRDPRTLERVERRRLLAASTAMVFQDPLSSFNPVIRMGTQLTESRREHRGGSRRAAEALAIRHLRALRISAPERRLRQFPHELSGGMRQRAMIAMALMLEPQLIVADEPTTALDVTVQRDIIAQLRDINRDTGTALLLISHDVSVIAALCERVVVMYAGRVVEELPVAALDRAAHPYTRALVAAVPTMATDRSAPLSTIPGRPPDVGEELPGCPFAARCQHADARCRSEAPSLERSADRRRVACWHPQAPARADGGHVEAEREART